MDVALVSVVHDAGDGTFHYEKVSQCITSVHNSAMVYGRQFDLIIIDNSKSPIYEMQRLACSLDAIYKWCDGYNTFHGPSMNMAARMSAREAIIYFCSVHGRVVDDGWLGDILAPLSNSRCGIAGCLASCIFDRVSGDPVDWHRPQLHIQGAIAAMRRDVLLRVPYSHRFPFEYSDVQMSLSLIQKGFTLDNVDSIRSVPEGQVDTCGAKYIHDYS